MFASFNRNINLQNKRIVERRSFINKKDEPLTNVKRIKFKIKLNEDILNFLSLVPNIQKKEF